MLTPYYEDEQATIFLGDCIEILAAMPADSVDMVLTDPPYGVKWRSSMRTVMFEKIEGDDSKEIGQAALSMLSRPLRTNRHAYVFGPFVFPPEFSRQVE